MVKINPKLLDVVQLMRPPSRGGELQYGTIVEMLGETPGAALVEVSGEDGIPVAFVHRALDEIDCVSEGIKPVVHNSETPDAQLCFENGVLFLQNGWYDRAKEQFSKSFSLDPRFRGSLVNTTNQLAARGAFESAIVVYTMLLELSPDYALARENLAITHMNRAILLGQHGLFQQAMDGFLKGLALHPSAATAQKIRDNMVATCTQLGLLYSNTNQHQLAFESFQRAFELDQSEISRKNLGVAMIAVSTVGTKNRSAEARAEMFREPLFMGLTLSECLTAFGATLAMISDIVGARLALEEALDADPQNKIARHNLDVISSREPSRGIQTGLMPIQNQPLEAMRL